MKFDTIKNKSGKDSSIRVVLLLSYLNLLLFIYLWNKALTFELNSDSIDYQGLGLLFSVMVVQTALPIVAKVLEKKYEEKK